MLTDKDGNPLKSKEESSVPQDFNIRISKRSASHTADKEALSKQVGRTMEKFSSEEDMINKAQERFQTNYEKEKQKDLSNGFNIDDENSILSYEIDYTPIGTMIVKFIKEEIKIGNLYLPDNGIENKKAIVMIPSLYDTVFRKGDIILFRPTKFNQYGKSEFGYPPHLERQFKNVTFQEISAEDISGILTRREEVVKRIQ